MKFNYFEEILKFNYFGNVAEKPSPKYCTSIKGGTEKGKGKKGKGAGPEKGKGAALRSDATAARLPLGCRAASAYYASVHLRVAGHSRIREFTRMWGNLS